VLSLEGYANGRNSSKMAISALIQICSPIGRFPCECERVLMRLAREMIIYEPRGGSRRPHIRGPK
jgi:hypothetical protein